MNIIDGRKIKDEILEKVRSEVLSLPFTPIFCDILVGSDPSSLQYVKMKQKISESVGIKFRSAEFKDDATTEDVLDEIDRLNRVPFMSGIIVQLPLPSHIEKQTVLDAIAPNLDVDCLGSYNSENFYNDNGEMGYPTALACMHILDSINVELKDKNIVVVGRGKLVGLPVTHLLKNRGLHVEVVHSQTENADEIIKNADVIISAIGKAKHIKGGMVKKDAIIIDAGTSEDNGAVSGDVDLDSMMGIASYISPTPGGVGPVTVAMLLENIINVAKNKINHE